MGDEPVCEVLQQLMVVKESIMNGNRLRFSTVFSLWIYMIIGDLLGFCFVGGPVVITAFWQGISLLYIWLLVRYAPGFPY